MIRMGLIGARGYVGRELIGVLADDARFDLAFAGSRSEAGRSLGAVLGEGLAGRFGDHVFEAVGPGDLAARPADVYVLGLPNGEAAPFVEALAPDAMIIDLSADYRHKPGWAYGAPELNGAALKGVRRIANPGCYATAANLALAPLADLFAGPVSVFGLSGYSGAGTTPSPRNDPQALKDNIIGYGYGGHGHQSEIASATGLSIAFAPNVAAFFRGLQITAIGPLKPGVKEADAEARLERFAAAHPRVRLVEAPPQPRDAAGTDLCLIGGLAIQAQTGTLTIAAALDNLRKGAATQALDNVKTALGLDV